MAELQFTAADSKLNFVAGDNLIKQPPVTITIKGEKSLNYLLKMIGNCWSQNRTLTLEDKVIFEPDKDWFLEREIKQ